MEYEIRKNDDRVTVLLRSELQFEDHEDFRGILKRIREIGPRSCTFDLSGLESADSAGLGMLMIAHQRSKEERWQMALRQPQGHVKRLLEITDLGRVIPIE